MSAAVALVAALLVTGSAQAQNTPGYIFVRSTYSPVSPLDPDNNRWASRTIAGFLTDDLLDSELPYNAIPQMMVEPFTDSASGSTSADLVDSPTSAASFVLYVIGPDGVPDTADDSLLFRMRLDQRFSGAYGFSILLDTDERFGFTGANADPNAVVGNPGFEAELLIVTNGTNTGVNLMRADGRATPTRCMVTSLDQHTQQAWALTRSNGDADSFFDLFVKLSDLKTCFTITSATRVRLIAATNNSPDSALGGGASDISGIADNDPRYVNNDDAFIAALGAIPSAPIIDLGPGGGFDTRPPETTITSGPPALSASASATFTFTSNEPAATFECAIDGSAYAACVTPATFGSLTDGPHLFAVRARDATNNVDGSPAIWAWLVDTSLPAPPVIIDPPTGALVAPLTLRFRGTAEPDSTVSVIIDGIAAGTTPADSSGFWFFTPPTPPAVGEHTAVATATDEAGNTSGPSAVTRFTVDPDVLDTAILSGPPSASSSTTADFTFLASKPAATFECSLDGGAFAPCANPARFIALAQLAHHLAVRARLNDEVDASPATWDWTVDTTAPAAPIITWPTSGARVGTTTPRVTGTAEAGTSVALMIDGAEVGSAATDARGQWSLQLITALAAGSHTATARASDKAGNRSPASAAVTFTVDLDTLDTFILSGPPPFTNATRATFDVDSTAKKATFECSLDGAAFAVCSDPVELTGLLEGAHLLAVRARTLAGTVDPTPATWRWTVDRTAPPAPTITSPRPGAITPPIPLVQGAAEANGTLVVSLNGVTAGKVAVDASGLWSFAPPEPLAEGDHTVSAHAIDAAGNAGPSSPTVPFVVDLSPPDTFVLSGPPEYTRDTVAAFAFGSDEANVVFECSLDGGSFQACPPLFSLSVLDDGLHLLRVRAVDEGGTVDPTPASHSWTLDRSAPAAAIILTPGAGETVGPRPVISGTAEAGASVAIAIDGLALGSAAADAVGNWSLTPGTPLADGGHTATATARDPAGNIGPAASRDFVVDAIPPDTEIVSGPAAITNSSSATFVLASGEPDATFECSVDGAAFEPCATPVTFADLAEGPHTLRARALDRFGNADDTPASYGWRIDQTAPEAPVITEPVSGAVVSATPRFSGTAEAGSAVTVRVDGLEVGTGFTDAAGVWSLLPEVSLANGVHTAIAVATDSAGNAGPPSAAVAFVSDGTPPETTITSGPATPTRLTWAEFQLASSEIDVSFECSLDGAAFDACVAAPAFSDLSEGEHTFAARARDVAQNVDPSPATWSWLIDLTAPETNLIAGPPALTSATDAAFEFSSSEPGTFECSLDGAQFAACGSPAAYAGLADGDHGFAVRAIDAAGNADPTPATHAWRVDATPPDTTIISGPAARTNATSASFTVASNDPEAVFECSLDGGPFLSCAATTTFAGLAAGDHTLAARAVDAAGNPDPEPAVWSWTIDLLAPQSPVILTPIDGSAVPTPTPAITGTAEAGSTVTLAIDGGLPATLTADANGTWAFTPADLLADGLHTVSAFSTDVAGNASGPATATFTVDTMAPDTAIVSGPAALVGSARAEFELASNEAGVVFECSLDGAGFAPCSNPATFTGLADGEHLLEVRARDAAGNVDETPARHAWTVDTRAPAAPVITSPDEGGVAETSTPTITGTADASTLITVFIDGVEAGQTRADAQGAWSFITAALEDGPHTVTATATDSVGNESPPSTEVHFRVRTGILPPPTIDSPAHGDALATATPRIAGTARPGSSVEVLVDGVALGSAVADEAGRWALDPAAPIADGTRTLTAVATDPEGRVSQPSLPVEVLIDTRPPETTIAAPLVDVLGEQTQLEFSADEPACSFECSVDGAEFTACESPLEIVSMAGSHSLEVRARDAVGNVDPTPARLEWPVPLGEESLRGSGCGCSSSSEPSPLLALGLLGLFALRRRRFAAGAAGAAGAALLLLGTSTAQAQSTPRSPNLEFERLMLNPSVGSSLVFGLGDVLPAGEFRLGLAGHYEHQPLTYYRNSLERGALVSRRVTAHLLAAWSPISRLELDLQVPVIVHQAGDDLSAYGFGKPSSTGLGTPLLRGRYGLLSVASGAPVNLAAEVGMRAPIGMGSSFGSEGTFGLDLHAGASRRFGLFEAGAQIGGLLRQTSTIPGGADGGSLLQTGSLFDVGGTLAYGGEGPRAEVNAWLSIPRGDLPVSGEVLLGGRLPIGAFDVFALAGPGLGQYPGTPVFRAITGVGFNRRVQAAAPAAHIPDPCDPGQRHTPEQCPDLDDDRDGVANAADLCPLEPGLTALRGCPDKDADGLADREDGCPDEAGPVERQGCPERDSDGDGLVDAEDACPDEKGELALKGCPARDSDGDGLVDAEDACPDEKGEVALKGCPARDSDGDGLRDHEDQCPAVAGLAELAGCPAVDSDGDTVADHLDNCIHEKGPPSNQGCPLKKKQYVIITREKLVIADKVYFATGKATIASRSFLMLGQVAEVLNSHPEIKKVQIEGHTDDRGGAELNRRLSQARAESVRTFLVTKGVEPSRLDARGFGPDRPADTNRSAKGRENNRRVEFMIVGEPKPEVVRAELRGDESQEAAHTGAPVKPSAASVSAVEEKPAATGKKPALLAADAPRIEEPKHALPEGTTGRTEPRAVTKVAAAPETGCDRAVLARHLQRHEKALQSCYERTLKSGNMSRGKVTLLLTIGKAGQVRDLEVEEDTLKNPEVVRCLRNTIRMWAFAMNGEECRVSYPLVFAPKL